MPDNTSMLIASFEMAMKALCVPTAEKVGDTSVSTIPLTMLRFLLGPIQVMVMLPITGLPVEFLSVICRDQLWFRLKFLLENWPAYCCASETYSLEKFPVSFFSDESRLRNCCWTVTAAAA